MSYPSREEGNACIYDLGKPACPTTVKIANIQIALPYFPQNLEQSILDEKFQMRDSPLAQDHQTKVLGFIEQALEEKCQLIILPELSSSSAIEEEARKKLQAHPGDCFLICGSYYRDGYNQSPIFVKQGECLDLFRQEKFFPSQSEKKIMKPGRKRLLFVNTGIGDLSVFICYDANDWRVFPGMEKLVDYLVVVAYNKALDTFRDRFERACVDHYYAIVYCNDGLYGESSCFLPLGNAKNRQFHTIPASIEKKAVFDLDLSWLEAGRRGEKPVSKDFGSLAYPPANIQTGRYGDLAKRTLAYLSGIVQHQENQLLPLGLKVRLDHIRVAVATCDHCQSQIEGVEFIPGIIDRRSFRIGKHKTNNLPLSVEGVSRFHGTISYSENNGFIYTDTRSKNGTKVGNALLQNAEEEQSVELTSGTTLCLAPGTASEVYLRFQVLQVGEEASPEPTRPSWKDTIRTLSGGNIFPCPHCEKIIDVGKIETISRYRPSGEIDWKPFSPKIQQD